MQKTCLKTGLFVGFEGMYSIHRADLYGIEGAWEKSPIVMLRINATPFDNFDEFPKLFDSSNECLQVNAGGEEWIASSDGDAYRTVLVDLAECDINPALWKFLQEDDRDWCEFFREVEERKA